MTERIVAVALQYPRLGIVCQLPAPHRHREVIAWMAHRGYTREQIAECDQGYVTDKGRFVSRRGALEIASAAGQLKPRRPGQYDGPELFSEDLW
jgi:hypothetical protein